MLRALGAIMEMYTPLTSENSALTSPNVLIFDPLSMPIARDNFLALATEVRCRLACQKAMSRPKKTPATRA